MKKVITAVFCLSLALGMMTACRSNNGNGGNGETTTTGSSSQSSSSQTDGSGLLEDLGDIPEDLSAELSEGMTKLADVVEGAVEWPAMMIVNDTNMLRETFLLDKNNPNYKDIMVKQAAMSAAFGEYIVIEAVEGKVDEVVKDLEARKTKLIEEDAFYPEHKRMAENTIVGKVGNHAYLIAAEDPQTIETALKEELSK